MKNDYLEYYGEHSISPVKQNIEDIEVHYERRRKLYRQCGVPVLAFRNAEMLEVGPGGGYNTLAFFNWKIQHIDLVEANTQGINDMQQLFLKYDISKEKYQIFQKKIEDFQIDKQYDIIIAEGFLPYIYNQREVIKKLQDLVAVDGIIVITCVDNVCMFIEAMKRLVGIALSADIVDYEQKVDYLTEFFEPQLAKLRGVSRSAKEWVQDQILCPAGVNGMELSIVQAMEYFDDGFEVLGGSPKIFTDYSWYKDIWYDYKADYKEQFAKKRLSFLLANMPEVILPKNKVYILVQHFELIKKFAAEYEKTLDNNKIREIIEEMDYISEQMILDFNDKFMNIFKEIKEVLYHICKNEEINMNKYPLFFSAFGRTQQYISFVKK